MQVARRDQQAHHERAPDPPSIMVLFWHLHPILQMPDLCHGRLPQVLKYTPAALPCHAMDNHGCIYKFNAMDLGCLNVHTRIRSMLAEQS